MDNFDKIYNLMNMGLTQDQIKSVVTMFSTEPEVKPEVKAVEEKPTCPNTPQEQPQPQIDYKALAIEIQKLNQKTITATVEQPVSKEPEKKGPVTQAELDAQVSKSIMGFLG